MICDEPALLRTARALVRWFRRGEWLSGDLCPIDCPHGVAFALEFAARMDEWLASEGVVVGEQA